MRMVYFIRVCKAFCLVFTNWDVIVFGCRVFVGFFVVVFNFWVNFEKGSYISYTW
jgi:hypothetical protein